MKTSVSAQAKRGETEPAGPESAYMEQERQVDALYRHLQESPTLSCLYIPHLTLARHIELPILVVENQPPPTFVTGSVWFEMMRLVTLQRLANTAIHAVRKRDVELAVAMGPLTPVDIQALVEDAEREAYPPSVATTLTASLSLPTVDMERARQFKQKKWLLDRTTESTRLPRYPNEKDAAYKKRLRAFNKAEIERLILGAIEAYTNTLDVRCFFAALKAAGLNCHDVCDALGLAMQKALDQFADVASALLPRRRPHEVRSDTPPLFHVEQTRAGTVRVAAMDPGITNIGFCVIELAGMVAPPEGRAPLLRGAPDEPEPVFRILCLELIDLKRPWSDALGQAVRSYHPTNPAWMAPDYTTPRDLRNVFLPLPSVPAAAAAPIPPKKRKRAVHIKEEPDGDRKPARGTKKPRKVVDTVDFPPLGQ